MTARASPRRAWGVIAATVVVAASAVTPARADDVWNPFRERDQVRTERNAKTPPVDRPNLLPPMRGGDAQASTDGGPAPSAPALDRPASDRAGAAEPFGRSGPPDERARAVSRSELPAIDAPTPVVDDRGTVDGGKPAVRDQAATPADGPASGDIWQGLDARAAEAHVAKIPTSLPSPAMSALWRRVVTASGAPAGAEAGDFEAFRLDRLLRSGLIDAASAIVAAPAEETASAGGPLNRLFRAKTAIALGLTERGCAIRTELGKRQNELQPAMRTELLLLAGYCAATAGNRAAAGLSAELAREAGVTTGLALASLDAFAADGRPVGPLPKLVTLGDYRYLQLGPGILPSALVGQADAALLAVLARDTAVDGGTRIAAGERAARANAIDAAELADIYRSAAVKQPAPVASETPAAVDASTSTSLRRAELFRSAEAEKTPLKRARLVWSLLDDARRAGLYAPMLKAVAGMVREMQIVPEYGWFAETAVEVLIADGRFDEARRMVDLAERIDRPAGGDGVKHWLALIDIADPRMAGRRGDMLPSVEQLALKGRLAGPALHRLATVLDALDTNVPVALWDSANKAPPPGKGFLPETGVLTELADASKKAQVGRTFLLALRSLGPDGPETTELIALGDTIRALRRVGAEAEARNVALEALFAGWPRGT